MALYIYGVEVAAAAHRRAVQDAQALVEAVRCARGLVRHGEVVNDDDVALAPLVTANSFICTRYLCARSIYRRAVFMSAQYS